jgi:hypothetical protein
MTRQAKNIGHNRLPALLARIQVAHMRVEKSTGDAFGYARQAGEHLLEAKAITGPRRWLEWLRETGLSARTAQGYMQLAQLPEEKARLVAHLGVRGALRAIAKRYPGQDEKAALAAARERIKKADEEARAEEKEQRHIRQLVASYRVEQPEQPKQMVLVTRPDTDRQTRAPRPEQRAHVGLDDSPAASPVPLELAALRVEPPPPMDRVAIAERALDQLNDAEWEQVKKHQNDKRAARRVLTN